MKKWIRAAPLQVRFQEAWQKSDMLNFCPSKLIYNLIFSNITITFLICVVNYSLVQSLQWYWFKYPLDPILSHWNPVYIFQPSTVRSISSLLFSHLCPRLQNVLHSDFCIKIFYIFIISHVLHVVSILSPCTSSAFSLITLVLLHNFVDYTITPSFWVPNNLPRILCPTTRNICCFLTYSKCEKQNFTPIRKRL